MDLGIDEVELSDEIFNATVEEISSAVKGKKDYSKYKFEGNEGTSKFCISKLISSVKFFTSSIYLIKLIK